jgi:hypothetical protein
VLTFGLKAKIMSKINVKATNQTVTPTVNTLKKLSLPPLLSFQDAWAHNVNGDRIFKVTQGDQFFISATLRVQAQGYSTPVLPANVGLEFVHIYLKDATIDKKVDSEFQQLTCQNTGDFAVQRQYHFPTQTTIVKSGPLDPGTTIQVGGEQGLHIFQIIADLNTQTESAYMTISPLIYLRIT